MKRTHKHLEVVIGAQVDYLLPEGKAAVPQGHQIIVPGTRRLMDLMSDSCAAVLFVNNAFTEDEYAKSDYSKEFRPHCLIAGLSDYEEPGVQNIFNDCLLTPRGVPVFRGYKKTKSIWDRDMWDNAIKINGQRGSAAVAETMPQFMGVLEEQGVSNIVLWGVDTETDLVPAIDGFLTLGFRVKVLVDLCHSRVHHSVSYLTNKFSNATAAHQLEVHKYADELQASKRKPL